MLVRGDRGIKVQTELGIYQFSTRPVEFETQMHNIHALQARITVHREHCKELETIFVRIYSTHQYRRGRDEECTQNCSQKPKIMGSLGSHRHSISKHRGEASSRRDN